MLILCVDDDQPVRSVVGDMIRELGHDVIEAEDGPSALRGLERFGRAVDVMMTDIRMPGMTGFNLVRQALKHHPKMRIVYTTGFYDGPASPGVTLLKPCTAAQLDRAINLESGTRL